MRAHVGDRLVIENMTTEGTLRDGEIVGLHHEDGTPPYDVYWSDTGEVTLVFPGPDAHIHPIEQGQPAGARGPNPAGGDVGAAGYEAAALRVPRPGDIGRRVIVERRRKGLSREETAQRARMSPAYLRYLEEQPADPGVASLIRLADALGTTVTSLRGGDADLPPGQGYALRRPQLRDLDTEECRALLSTHGVGRVAVCASDGRPAVVPVNYAVVDDAIVYRTAPHSTPAAAVGTEVAFEVDHMDEALSKGWSVLVVGPASAVTAPDAVRRLTELAPGTPWAGGVREMWVSIRPERLTGRRITAAPG
ncbi:pyridoxamine 5'-phosphate oxidase family protein [Streptomyces adustus]|uniref:pyridoxamine 5'-phosphate oxidase family protein n=1 Tax=Streptomyces adustus TaxID=1609272 RepID=UPI00371CE054